MEKFGDCWRHAAACAMLFEPKDMKKGYLCHGIVRRADGSTITHAWVETGINVITQYHEEHHAPLVGAGCLTFVLDTMYGKFKYVVIPADMYYDPADGGGKHVLYRTRTRADKVARRVAQRGFGPWDATTLEHQAKERH